MVHAISLIPFDLMKIIVFCEEWTSSSCPLWHLLMPPVTSLHLGPYTFLGTLLSKIFSRYTPSIWQTKIHTHVKQQTWLKFRIFLSFRDKWVPVTMKWRVLRSRMKERPPIWRVTANILNKQSRTVDKGWSSSIGVRRGVDNNST
jgi:hypothetical protein